MSFLSFLNSKLQLLPPFFLTQSLTKHNMATAGKSAQKHYEAIKDVVLTDFLDVEAETTFNASEIWKEKPTVVVGNNYCLYYDVFFFLYCSL